MIIKPSSVFAVIDKKSYPVTPRNLTAILGQSTMSLLTRTFVCFCPKRTLACLSAFDGIGAESRVFVSDFLRGFEVRRIIGLHCRIEIIEYVDDNARFR